MIHHEKKYSFCQVHYYRYNIQSFRYITAINSLFFLKMSVFEFEILNGKVCAFPSLESLKNVPNDLMRKIINSIHSSCRTFAHFNKIHRRVLEDPENEAAKTRYKFEKVRLIRSKLIAAIFNSTTEEADNLINSVYDLDLEGKPEAFYLTLSNFDRRKLYDTLRLWWCHYYDLLTCNLGLRRVLVKSEAIKKIPLDDLTGKVYTIGKDGPGNAKFDKLPACLKLNATTAHPDHEALLTTDAVFEPRAINLFIKIFCANESKNVRAIQVIS